MTTTSGQGDLLYCRQCGERADQGTRVCPACGAALSESQSSALHPQVREFSAVLTRWAVSASSYASLLGGDIGGWTSRAAQLGSGKGWRVVSGSGSLVVLLCFFFQPWLAAAREFAWGITARVEVAGISIALGSLVFQVLAAAKPVPFWLNLWLIIPETVAVIAVSLFVYRRLIAALTVVILAVLELLTIATTWQSFAGQLPEGTHLEAETGLVLSVLGIVAVIAGATVALMHVVSQVRSHSPGPPI
jgi:hypothetical protein